MHSLKRIHVHTYTKMRKQICVQTKRTLCIPLSEVWYAITWHTSEWIFSSSLIALEVYKQQGFLIICKFTNRRFSVSEFYLQELLLLFSKYTIGFVCRRNLQTKSSLIGLEMYKEQVLWLLRKFTDNKFPDCLENLHKAVIVPEMFSLYSRIPKTSTFLVLDNSQTTVCSCSRNLQSTSSLAGLNFYS